MSKCMTFNECENDPPCDEQNEVCGYFADSETILSDPNLQWGKTEWKYQKCILNTFCGTEQLYKKDQDDAG